MPRGLSRAVLAMALTVLVSCSGDVQTNAPSAMEVDAQRASDRTGFVLHTGGGEVLNNGIVVKLSPANGTEGSILVEQTFPQGGSTILHRHDQGDELFYVVSGTGTATLSGATERIGAGDVVFVPRSEVHAIQNLNNATPLRVVFFMDSPELVEQFRAIHERIVSDPDNPPTAAELAEIEARYRGGVAVSDSANRND